jgi:hypothetical protein
MNISHKRSLLITNNERKPVILLVREVTIHPVPDQTSYFNRARKIHDVRTLFSDRRQETPVGRGLGGTSFDDDIFSRKKKNLRTTFTLPQLACGNFPLERVLHFLQAAFRL